VGSERFAFLQTVTYSAWRRFAEVLRQLLRGLGQRPKAPRADHELPVGPAIPDPDDIDLHRPGASSCRDFRHHANPDAGGDHLADRIETVQPRTKAQTRAETGRMSADMGVQRDRADQSDEITLHHVAEIDLPPTSQFVVPRGDQHQTVLSASACSAASPRSAAPMAMARAISLLSRSSTSIEM